MVCVQILALQGKCSLFHRPTTAMAPIPHVDFDNTDRLPCSLVHHVIDIDCLHRLQSSRQELIQDVDELKKKITGAAEE